MWPLHKCRSLWPIFHGPVILSYILKTIWYMNIILWDTIWPDVWPKNKCRSLWPRFHGLEILPIYWRIFNVWTSYLKIMSQYDPTFDLKINVGHSNLYFMVQWLCLISWRICNGWTSYLGIMSHNDLMFDLKIFVGHCDLCFHGPLFLPYNLKTVWYMSVILCDYESVWCDLCPKSLWPIFSCPVILPYILSSM